MESKGEGFQIQSNEDIDIMFLKCEGFISHYYEKHFVLVGKEFDLGFLGEVMKNVIKICPFSPRVKFHKGGNCLGHGFDLQQQHFFIF